MWPRTDPTLHHLISSLRLPLGRYLGLFLLVCCAVPLRAIDPLPADIQQASPEVQARYLERTARQGLEEKTKVGLERYQQRVQLRQALHQQMMAEVQARQAEITAIYGGDTRSRFMSYLKPMAIVVGCAIALIFVVQAWRRAALA